MTTRVQDFYKATITRNWTATIGDFNVSVAPTITAGIIVISPNSTTQREIVRYTATGTNQYGPFVTISDVADRGLSGTTAQSHIIGEQVRMNVTAVHWDELLADAVAPTVDVGTTTTLEPGSDATATNSGTTIDAILDFGIPAGSTIYSGTSIPDNSVGRNGDWAFDTSVNCYVWYKSGGSWSLVNSLKGATGDGNGIASITKTGTVGLVDTYTITYDDASTSTFNITNGAKGDTGDDGVSVVSIIKTDTTGLVDTYTITYSNSTTSTFDVTNGQDGTNGLDGTDGIDGISFLWQGAYDNGTAYKVNDAVSYNGSSYICKLDSTGNLPTNTTYWDVMAQKGTDGAGSGDVIGPATNTANYIPQWDGADSKTLKDGLGLDTDLSSVSANDDTVPSAKATKTYADSKVEDSIVDGHTTVAPSGNAVFDALALKANISSIREALTADRTYYVRTDGNDSNNGLTNDASGAFLTIQKAIDTVASLDCSVYNVIIQVADGTYTGNVALKSIIGSGTVTIKGNITTPANVHINTTGDCINGISLTNVYVLNGLKLTASGVYSRCIVAIGSPTYIKFLNIEFDTGYSHISCDGFGAKVEAIGNYSIVGNVSNAHLQCVGGGKIAISGRTITLVGTISFSLFVWMDRGLGLVEAYSCTFVGSATGKRYSANNNAVIFTNGAGANYFPGNSAGAVATGGLYV